MRENGAPTDRGKHNQFTEEVTKQLNEYFEGKRKRFDLAIEYSRCTPFQAKVYSELANIPYGERRSYRDIAIAIGCPKGARAIGMANNRNPIQIIIPCHRVVGSSGRMVGYAGGVDTKEYLLKLED